MVLCAARTFLTLAGAIDRLTLRAVYGNRTRLLGLGSRCTTDVLTPHYQNRVQRYCFFCIYARKNAFFSLLGAQRDRAVYGNRTRLLGLGSRCTTDVLTPRACINTCTTARIALVKCCVLCYAFPKIEIFGDPEYSIFKKKYVRACTCQKK